jgi:ArsR family transcriptional regulator
MVATTLLSGLAPGRCLEVGPGDGRLLRWLAGRFREVSGLDTSVRMLETARAATRDLANVRLDHRDFLELPAQRRYHLIIASMVVHHLASPAAFFRQAGRVLKSGGALILAELCSHDQQWAGEACGDQWLGFDVADLTRWAEAAGLRCVESQYLAQKNGFRIQAHRYLLNAATPKQTSNHG